MEIPEWLAVTGLVLFGIFGPVLLVLLPVIYVVSMIFITIMLLPIGIILSVFGYTLLYISCMKLLLLLWEKSIGRRMRTSKDEDMEVSRPQGLTWYQQSDDWNRCAVFRRSHEGQRLQTFLQRVIKILQMVLNNR